MNGEGIEGENLFFDLMFDSGTMRFSPQSIERRPGISAGWDGVIDLGLRSPVCLP
jgi:hypothetical protein